eukprot:CAMPEP_0178452162 /NCGR_PEP_ID=MMETSP0689_2-20121128/44086_1 /TAXON_ID=160604 /ORGANISM="Amphidinium massartii, Strain CS-259" /LENGTH=58 /DNA_ID=CAMNT_0020077827 /DNA_START=118 /DNA_END=294 /DNA_ORIENTATION=+
MPKTQKRTNEKKESAIQRRARKSGNADAQQYAPYILGGLGAFFVIVFIMFIYLAHFRK